MRSIVRLLAMCDRPINQREPVIELLRCLDRMCRMKQRMFWSMAMARSSLPLDGRCAWCARTRSSCMTIAIFLSLLKQSVGVNRGSRRWRPRFLCDELLYLCISQKSSFLNSELAYLQWNGFLFLLVRLHEEVHAS